MGLKRLIHIDFDAAARKEEALSGSNFWQWQSWHQLLLKLEAGKHRFISSSSGTMSSGAGFCRHRGSLCSHVI
ncbi:hypothetical protein Ancab_008199 [Ancistrocladus abbreviatus]